MFSIAYGFIPYYQYFIDCVSVANSSEVVANERHVNAAKYWRIEYHIAALSLRNSGAVYIVLWRVAATPAIAMDKYATGALTT